MLQVDVHSPDPGDHHARSPDETIQQDLKWWNENLLENPSKSIKLHQFMVGFQFRIYSHILHSHLIIFNLQNDGKSTNTWESTTPKFGFNMF